MIGRGDAIDIHGGEFFGATIDKMTQVTSVWPGGRCGQDKIPAAVRASGRAGERKSGRKNHAALFPKYKYI